MLNMASLRFFHTVILVQEATSLQFVPYLDKLYRSSRKIHWIQVQTAQYFGDRALHCSSVLGGYWIKFLGWFELYWRYSTKGLIYPLFQRGSITGNSEVSYYHLCNSKLILPDLTNLSDLLRYLRRLRSSLHRTP